MEIGEEGFDDTELIRRVNENIGCAFLPLGCARRTPILGPRSSRWPRSARRRRFGVRGGGEREKRSACMRWLVTFSRTGREVPAPTCNVRKACGIHAKSRGKCSPAMGAATAPGVRAKPFDSARSRCCHRVRCREGRHRTAGIEIDIFAQHPMRSPSG